MCNDHTENRVSHVVEFSGYELHWKTAKQNCGNGKADHKNERIHEDDCSDCKEHTRLHVCPTA